MYVKSNGPKVHFRLRQDTFPTGLQRSKVAFQAYQGPLVPGWARNVEYISLGDVPAEALNINVNGRKVVSPVNGFGCLWDKKYRFRIEDKDMEPQRIVSLWKSEFPNFWPKGNSLFTSGGAPIAPGTTALLNLSIGGLLMLATGIMVIYADDRSFCFSALQGHMFCGWITFSSFREDHGIIIQVHPLLRLADPVTEMSFRLGAALQEDLFWHQTLRNLASRLGVEGKIEQHDDLIDRHFQWSGIRNIWHSSAIRSSLYMPLYLLRRIFS